MTADVLVGQPTVLIVQHSPDDPPSRLGGWLAEGGCVLEVVRCDLGERLPQSLAGYAGLVVLGGAMGAYDDAQVPWLGQTKALLREAADRDLPTLGICLGHQLLAVANGGRVEVAGVHQGGVTPVSATAAAAQDPLFAGLSGDALAVHWNQDVVLEPPPGAVVLATSAAGVQGFRLGERVWGVQFHPEVDLATVTGWAEQDVAAGRVDAEAVRRRLADIAETDDAVRATWGPFVRRFAEQTQPVTEPESAQPP